MSPELDAIHDLLSILNLNPPKFMHFVSDAAPVISEICFNYCLHTKFIKLALSCLLSYTSANCPCSFVPYRWDFTECCSYWKKKRERR